MGAGATMEQCFKLVAGISGSLALALETRKAVPRALILEWVTRLRGAADELEKLL